MAKKLSLVPLGDRVLVLPEEKGGEKKLASGIIIPETVDKDKLMKGEVMATGPGRKTDDGKHIAVDVKAGDTVFFKKPWDEPIKVDGIEYFILSESEILGIVK
jgi:chaperonin GroES